MVPPIDGTSRTIRWIVTHLRPDLDALLSVYQVQTYGGRHQPPLKAPEARLHFGEPTPQIRQGLERGYAVAVDTQERGVLVFDHHGPQAEGRSTAEILGERLQITHYPGMKELIGLANRSDEGKAGSHTLVQWIRMLDWHKQSEPEATYRFFAPIFRGIVRLSREADLPLDFELEERIRVFAAGIPEAEAALKELGDASRKQPQDRAKALFTVRGLVNALRTGCSNEEEFERQLSLLFTARIAWVRETEQAELEANSCRIIDVGPHRVAAGEYTSDRFTELVRTKHRPLVIVSRDTMREITGVVTQVGGPLRLGQIAEAVRRLEIEHRPDWSLAPGVDLSQVGTFVSWYLDHRGEKMLLCGSRTTPAPQGPSEIPFDELVDCVTETLRSQIGTLQPCGAA